MSTQPINNPAFQQLQGFYPSRTPDDKQAAPSTNGAPAFIVTITSTQGARQNHGFYEQRRAALDELGTALQAGDAAATQKAYDALVALGQNSPLRNGQTFRRADRAQEFADIGQALQSGDLAAAQTAFSALAGSFSRGTRLLGPPVSAPPSPSPSPSTSSLPLGPPTLVPPPSAQSGGPVGLPTLVSPPTPAADGPVGPPEIVINVGGSASPNGNAGDIVVNLPQPSSTPEEVQINLGNNGSNGQVKIDLAQKNGGEEISVNFSGGNNNYQLVLNLLQSNENAAAQKVSLQA